MNQLSKETSPYLLQHANNPVHWYPWHQEALALAREQDKPILLSIGYSACHWCHVMAHESFEDPATAELMNRLFVNIKVDREERPDLDRLYQTAHYLLTQRGGGWPLTVFLTPDDLVPFYAGTYFPPVGRHGLPGFRDLLVGVADLYRERHDEVRQQATALQRALSQAVNQRHPSVELGPQLLARAVDALAERYDADNGGFGQAPKFPHPTTLAFLQGRWLASRSSDAVDLKALEMLAYTLKKMALGGVNDQIGGGFCRYSVDDYWMIPHFEKMLYDNAQLMPLYATGAVTTGSALFRRVAIETGQWVIRDMQSAEGGYYSALDADSEGEEGKFYVWTRDEVASLLSEEEYLYFSHRYGLNRPPNFEGKWLPHVYMEYEELEKQFSRPETDIRQIVDMARNKLLAARTGRVWPGKDEKVLTSWNGLMIAGMAITGRLLGREDFIDSAEQALAFIQHELWVDGRLLATSKDGRAHLAAYLDDYAFLIDAILELLQARWNTAQLRFATKLADAMVEHFEDRENGGFFFTADDHERLLERLKPFADEALPAGNAVAAKALGRLGYLLGETRYIEASQRCMAAGSGLIAQAPVAHCGMLTALQEQLELPRIIVVRGEGRALEAWASSLCENPDPAVLGFSIPGDAPDLPPALAIKQGRDEGPVAYLCEGIHCAEPVVELEAFKRMLD